MKRRWLLALAMILAAAFPRAAAPTIAIDAASPTVPANGIVVLALGTRETHSPLR